MEEIVRKLDVAEIPHFVNIVSNAYPGIMQNTPESKERLSNNLINILENVESIDFFGLFRNGTLLGGMRIHYYTMNLFGRLVKTGGVGLVAVDLLHKKEKVAKELITSFIRHFQEMGISLVMLYPFRPDFYKKMGFGYGTKMNQYLIKPESFPKGNTKEGLMFLDETHKELVKECSDRLAISKHGMLLKTEYEIETIFKNPEHRVLGFMHDNQLRGYMVFTFKNMDKDNFLINNLIVKELVYENPDALSFFSTFLHSQSDQVNRVVLNTQDEGIEYLIDECTNGSDHLIPSVYHETSTSGIGLMYRIIDLKNFFGELSGHHFNGMTGSISLIIHDSFLHAEPQKFVLHFEEGMMTFSDDGEAEAEMEIEISDFASLVLGVIEAKKLYQYGKLTLSHPEYLEKVNQIFYCTEKPVCISSF